MVLSVHGGGQARGKSIERSLSRDDFLIANLELAGELAGVEDRLNGKSSLAELARLREQVARAADRAAWVADAAARKHLADKAAALLHRIGP